jgi:hypothetical protein
MTHDPRVYSRDTARVAQHTAYPRLIHGLSTAYPRLIHGLSGRLGYDVQITRRLDPRQEPLRRAEFLRRTVQAEEARHAHI